MLPVPPPSCFLCMMPDAPPPPSSYTGSQMPCRPRSFCCFRHPGSFCFHPTTCFLYVMPDARLLPPRKLLLLPTCHPTTYFLRDAGHPPMLTCCCPGSFYYRPPAAYFLYVMSDAPPAYATCLCQFVLLLLPERITCCFPAQSHEVIDFQPLRLKSPRFRCTTVWSHRVAAQLPDVSPGLLHTYTVFFAYPALLYLRNVIVLHLCPNQLW